MIDKSNIRYPPIQQILGTPHLNRPIQIKCPNPKHFKDRTPSFTIYPNGGFHCFGCRVHGKNGLDFLINVLGNSYKDSIKYLEDNNLISYWT